MVRIFSDFFFGQYFRSTVTIPKPVTLPDRHVLRNQPMRRNPLSIDRDRANVKYSGPPGSQTSFHKIPGGKNVSGMELVPGSPVTDITSTVIHSVGLVGSAPDGWDIIQLTFVQLDVKVPQPLRVARRPDERPYVLTVVAKLLCNVTSQKSTGTGDEMEFGQLVGFRGSSFGVRVSSRNP